MVVSFAMCSRITATMCVRLKNSQARSIRDRAMYLRHNFSSVDMLGAPSLGEPKVGLEKGLEPSSHVGLYVASIWKSLLLFLVQYFTFR